MIYTSVLLLLFKNILYFYIKIANFICQIDIKVQLFEKILRTGNAKKMMRNKTKMLQKSVPFLNSA